MNQNYPPALADRTTGTNLTDEVEQALQAFCAATQLTVCLKLLQPNRPPTGLETVFSRYSLHRSPFCMQVKHTRSDRCRQCDLRDVPVQCDRQRQIFSHTCHAGAGEVIIPLFADQTLVAIVFVGQFRTSKDQPAELPWLTAQKLSQVKGLSRLLASYLSERLRTPRFVSESSRGFRGEVIHRFLEENLRANPSLSELADHLGLSTARTAHAVREATGYSFVELRDALRLQRAQGLLLGTYHKVAHIATECGFTTPQYFHRFFRKKTGTTPSAFRRKYRTDV